LISINFSDKNTIHSSLMNYFNLLCKTGQTRPVDAALEWQGQGGYHCRYNMSNSQCVYNIAFISTNILHLVLLACFSESYGSHSLCSRSVSLPRQL